MLDTPMIAVHEADGLTFQLVMKPEHLITLPAASGAGDHGVGFSVDPLGGCAGALRIVIQIL